MNAADANLPRSPVPSSIAKEISWTRPQIVSTAWKSKFVAWGSWLFRQQMTLRPTKPRCKSYSSWPGALSRPACTFWRTTMLRKKPSAQVSKKRVPHLRSSCILYTQILHLVAEQSKPPPTSSAIVQELCKTEAGYSLQSLSNATRPPEGDTSWVMVAQFAPTESGRQLRASWANPNLSRTFAKDANGKWPEVGCKLGQPPSVSCQELGIQPKGKGKGRRVSPEERRHSPRGEGDGRRYRARKSESMDRRHLA